MKDMHTFDTDVGANVGGSRSCRNCENEGKPRCWDPEGIPIRAPHKRTRTKYNL